MAAPGVLETQIAKGPAWKIVWSILKPTLGPAEIGAVWVFTPELALPALQRTPTDGVDLVEFVLLSGSHTGRCRLFGRRYEVGPPAGKGVEVAAPTT